MANFIGYMNRLIRNNPFPSALIAIFIVLTTFGISGTSMAAFDLSAIGKSPGLLLGQPRPIRSDEWLVQSQETLIQKAANYPEVNKNVGQGENMSMMIDVPFRGFFTIFKPQNLFFFIMPYANAFAAKWWFMALALCLGFYFLITKLSPNKRLIASLGALLLLFNPFVQWWYLPGTLLSIAYGLWIGLFMILIFSDNVTRKRLILYSAGLAYFAVCFIFLLYPPFQIPVALGIAGLIVALIYHRYANQRLSIKKDNWRWLGFGLALIVAVVIAGSFLVAHSQIINTVSNTAYPGKRSFTSGLYGSGDNPFRRLFSAPILGNLQDNTKFAHYFSNQSEAAVFIFINLIFTPIVLFHILKKPHRIRTPAETYFIGTSIIVGLFVIRFFTPLFNLPFKFLLLDQVQNERAEIGLIVLCCIQLVLLGSMKLKDLTNKQALATGLLTAVVFGDNTLRTVKHYPGFISPLSAVLLCLLLGVIVYMLLRERLFKYGLVLFVILNMANSVFINPLYSRSEPKALEDLSSIIQNDYKDSKSWAAMDTLVYENAPLIAGKHSFTGVFVYPQLKLWESALDPDNKETSDYNRYAHVIFASQPFPEGQNFINPQGDVLMVKFSCDNAKLFPNLGYILTPTFVNTRTFPCLKESRKIAYPGVNLYYANLYIYAYTPVQ